MLEHKNDQDIDIPIQALISGLTCPECHSHKINKNGKRKHNRQYICRECNKTFSATTGTAIHGIKKRQQFEKYAHCIEEGLTIRQAAKQIGISVATSFAWRHKHLSAQRNTRNGTLQYVAVAGLNTTPYSQKGMKKTPEQQPAKPDQKTLIIWDLMGNTQLQVVPGSKQIKEFIHKSVKANTQIVAQRKTLLTRSLNHCNVSLNNINVDIRKCMLASVLHVDSQLKSWLNKFRGVSSRYLQQYWEWFCLRSSLIPSTVILQNSLCIKEAQQLYRKL